MLVFLLVEKPRTFPLLRGKTRDGINWEGGWSRYGRRGVGGREGRGEKYIAQKSNKKKKKTD